MTFLPVRPTSDVQRNAYDLACEAQHAASASDLLIPRAPSNNLATGIDTFHVVTPARSIDPFVQSIQSLSVSVKCWRTNSAQTHVGIYVVSIRLIRSYMEYLGNVYCEFRGF